MNYYRLYSQFIEQEFLKYIIAYKTLVLLFLISKNCLFIEEIN